ncbi:MAG: sucrase ferredoxin [Geodermatophilaceae bacterium]|nr:sucrase ferredoxin [Geodermatophilaceae bacterium]MDQ3463126.1 sucrase ferredoxin [Actinomycetota bacterium]
MTGPQPLTATTRCAPLSLARGDQRHGTAAPVARWLLIEQPGPWGRDAVLSSPLDPDVARDVDRRCREAGVRAMLIRKPGRAVAAESRQWAYVDSRLGRERIWWGEYGSDRQLVDIPLDGSAGRRASTPAYLVCTHARHDACCAIRGRPVAAALAALRPGQAWECSHTGGDRFAANVVVLPHGLYYGTVTPADVPGLVAAHEEGRVVLDLLRGRSALRMAVQAAQHHARGAVDDMGLTALPPSDVQHPAKDTWRVAFDHPRGEVVVTVRARSSDPVPRLTCSAAGFQRVVTFDVVEVHIG